MKEMQLRELLQEMSVKEKVGQLVQLMGAFYEKDVESVLTGPGKELGIGEEDIRLCGSILGTSGAENLMRIQKEYMEKQPHHIPMLFMMDVIHGMKTIFPMPLAQAAAFEPELTRAGSEIAAKEAAVTGLHVAFSPMSDLVRDARWGRVMESFGEDPYLDAQYTAAQVRGLQGEGMGEPGRLCACIKHFAGYGGAVAGRDYNTVELSEHTFREFYLKGYQAGIDAGAGMVMTSFNTINGIPATTNHHLMRDILRGEMGFDGVLISDFSAILETIAHGYSEDEADAAKKALAAGVDIDMMTSVYAGHLERLIADGEVEESLLDEAVWRVLALKNRLGLFENPYKDADPELEKTYLLCEENRRAAREAAAKTFVLLKNDGALPVDRKQRVAFIGPYTDRKQLLSSWAFTGDESACVTIKEAAQEVFDPERTVYLAGSPVLGAGEALVGFTGAAEAEVSEEEQEAMLREAVAAAQAAELVIMPIGEHYLQSGEATSRAMIEVPEVQMKLFREVVKVNPNVVVVLFNGRPLDLREISGKARAVLVAWLPGTEGGHAVVDVLTGKVNPSGRLPMSFPYCVGQVPVSYNAYSTGRPEIPGVKERFKSRYIDIPNAPLYPFGYGLGYTTFEISPVRLEQYDEEAEEKACEVAFKTAAEDAQVATGGVQTDAAQASAGNAQTDNAQASCTADKRVVMEDKGRLSASVTVKNTGNCAGTETLQLYIQDVAASVVRPVKELKGFRKVTLQPGESQEIAFLIDEPMLRFLRADGTTGSEPGLFRVWVAKDSASGEAAEFVLSRTSA